LVADFLNLRSGLPSGLKPQATKFWVITFPLAPTAVNAISTATQRLRIAKPKTRPALKQRRLRDVS